MSQERFTENNNNKSIASPKLPQQKSDAEKIERRSSSVIELERNLLVTSWVKEAELIQEFVPTEDLTKQQQKLLQKCIDKEEFTDKQLAELKLILNKYRKILQKIKPDKTLEEVDKAVQMMNSEKDFLDLLSPTEELRLLVHVKTIKGVKGFDFIVEPITDSRVIESLELQIDLFRDYSLEEQVIYSKATTHSDDLTEDERKIYERMNKEILDKQSHERIGAINRFLASQLTLEGSDATYDEKVRFWEVFPFNSKIGVFVRVQDMLGLSETKNSELFPTR